MSTTAQLIDDLVKKYQKMLGVSQTPKIKLVSRLGNTWNGYCVWSPVTPWTSLISLEKKITKDPLTLERILAHEMVHHWDFMSDVPRVMGLIERGIKPTYPEGHGARWLEGAAIVNHHMGAGFVTEKSDHVAGTGKKIYYLLIKPLPVLKQGRVVDVSWVYVWTAKITSAATEALVAREKLRGARLVKVTDEIWARGAKLGAKTTQWSQVANGKHIDLLKRLYEPSDVARDAVVKQLFEG